MHCFSIDFEDWYQGMMLPVAQWQSLEKRLHIGHERLLELLSRSGTKATYFLLGKTIEEHPNLIREIVREGHEVGCHSYEHRPIYEMTPESFRADLVKCKELAASIGISYTGFRAPYFSIDARSWWALDILKEEGFAYDSSIFPGSTLRTGVPGFSKALQRLPNGLPEAPMSVIKLMLFTPGTGGAYFRILPYGFFRQKLRQLEKQGHTVNFYIHPWELDPDHPKMPGLSRRVSLPHYQNLGATAGRLGRLLQDFSFGPIGDKVASHLQSQ